MANNQNIKDKVQLILLIYTYISILLYIIFERYQIIRLFDII